MAVKRQPKPPKAVTSTPKTLVVPGPSFTDVSTWTLNNPDGPTRDFSYDILKRSHRGVPHSAVKYLRAKLRHPEGSLDVSVLHRDVAANTLVLPASAPDLWARPHRLWSEMDDDIMRADQDLLAGPTIWFPRYTVQHWATRQVIAFAQECIADRYGAAVHIVAHAPGRIAHSADFHIHVLCTARTVIPAGFDGFIRPLLQTGCQREMKAEWDAWWASRQYSG